MMHLFACACFVSCILLSAAAQSPPKDTGAIANIKQLAAEERWQEIVRATRVGSATSAELKLYSGIALAHLGRWEEAREALLAGARLDPSDQRFPIELAGVEFKQRRYAQAATWLRRALRLEPSDTYGNDFLGSVYFVVGNLEAALKYWNRVGKPEIANVRMDPQPRVKPALLDRAFAFAPGSTLLVPELLTTKARVGGLGVFSSYGFDLGAREDGDFDVTLHASERNGFGKNKWEGLFRFFRGIFQQTVYPEYFNVGGSATNITSMVRWDAQKRRLAAALAGPWHGDPKWRYRLGVDLRNENWDLRTAFTGPAARLGALNLRRESASAGITSFAGARWSWSTGVEVSKRDYRSVFAGRALTSGLLSEGWQLKQVAEVKYELLRVPERRFFVTAAGSAQTGRIWSRPSHGFEKLQGSLAAHWFPQSHGDDYEGQASMRLGKTFGRAPFDELFMLGIERDNDLWLRAHVGTRDGRKGSAPLGREYVLFNSEMDKNVLSQGVAGVKLGPFVDVGHISDSSPGLGTKKWLWDAGGQAKVRVLGFGVVFVYGKDLRSGANAFYLTAAR